MKYRKYSILVILFCILISCSTKTAKIKNTKSGSLTQSHALKEVLIKKFVLDSNTAPKPQYMQIYNDSLGGANLTFLNTYNNSIYFYDYKSLKFIKKITYDRKGPYGILKPTGYYIKNMDSIYLYDIHRNDIVLTKYDGKIINKISLRGVNDSKTWYMYYPQYNTETVKPFIETSNKLLLIGQFQTIPDTLLSKYRFTAGIDKKTHKVNFSHKYPKSLYGYGFNWEGGLYTEVFPTLHHNNQQLVYSFPASHNLYISDLKDITYQKKVYAGSNEAGTIYSIDVDRRKTSRERFMSHIVRNDSYAAILYDKYREVYYRVLRRGIPNANISMDWKEKPIAIIIMDKEFNYLGETTLGTLREFNSSNLFVTEEGLNIEYLDQDDIDEVTLTLKIFAVEDI